MMKTINPYESINWTNVLHIPSCSHAHCKNQTILNRMVNEGLQHLALSNYHPSEPWYPLSEHFTVPSGVVGSPNAEFYSMEIDFMHLNGIGSTYSESEPAPTRTWKYKISNILKNMQYDDAGGITINHPSWTIATASDGVWGRRILQKSDVLDMLDFDYRVLGLEFYNGLAASGFLEEQRWSTELWDEVLLTGRRCWGFCVSDHDQERSDGIPWRGRNILLVDNFTEHDCLKAYREGRFYGSIYNTTLRFTNITLNGSVLSVAATDADYLNFVVDGNTTRINYSSANFNIPSNATYIRVEAHNENNSIYSNPIILRPYIKKEGNKAENILLLF